MLFDLRYPAAAVDAFVDALRVFRIGYSWAGPVSLAVLYDLAAMRQPNPYAGTLVRFALGMERVEDLMSDCAQALEALHAAAAASGGSAGSQGA